MSQKIGAGVITPFTFLPFEVVGKPKETRTEARGHAYANIAYMYVAQGAPSPLRKGALVPCIYTR